MLYSSIPVPPFHATVQFESITLDILVFCSRKIGLIRSPVESCILFFCGTFLTIYFTFSKAKNIVILFYYRHQHFPHDHPHRCHRLNLKNKSMLYLTDICTLLLRQKTTIFTASTVTHFHHN